MLHGAQKGWEAREADEHVFSSCEFALSWTLLVQWWRVRCDAEGLLTGWIMWGSQIEMHDCATENGYHGFLLWLFASHAH